MAGELRTERLSIVSTLDLTHHPDGPPLPVYSLDPSAEAFPFAYAPEEIPDLAALPNGKSQTPTRTVDAWARRFVGEKGKARTLAVLEAMTHAIKAEFRYEARHEEGTQTAAETIALGSGTCRDFAVLMMEALRSFGVATRFVTGYLYDDTSGTTRGGGSTHAWCNVYLPGAGWMEYDPTNGLVAGANLVRVGVARSAAQALPVSGGYVGAPMIRSGSTWTSRSAPCRSDLARWSDWGARGEFRPAADAIVEAPYVSTGRLPSPDVVRALVAEAHERFRTNRDGRVSDVYPALAKVPPDLFGLCVVGVNGAAYASGDWDSRSRS